MSDINYIKEGSDVRNRRIDISSREIAEMDTRFGVEQAILRLLKSKGFPVVGTVWLQPDPQFTYEQSYDRENDMYIYSWS